MVRLLMVVDILDKQAEINLIYMVVVLLIQVALQDTPRTKITLMLLMYLIVMTSSSMVGIRT
jgi:hypothetical protein